MSSEIDSINEKLNEIINHIPNKYRNSQYLDYISKQSFKQLALIKIFNKANNAFSFNVIPEEVIDDFILINILAKKKANIENNLHFFPNEQNVSFEDVYLKMKNSYQKHSFLAQFETTISFKEKENERFQKREFSEKLMKNEKQIYTKETIEYHDGNIESEMIPLETDNSRFNISNSPENISKEIQPNETEINNINDQQISSDKIIDSNEFEGTNEAITPLNTNGIRQDDSYTPDNILKDIPLDKTEEDIPLDKTEEDIPLNNTEEDIPLNKTEENIHLNNTEEDIPLNNTEEDILLNNTEEDIPLDKMKEDIPLDKTEEDIPLNKTEENIPLNNTEEDIPLNNTEEDIPLDNTEEDIPLNNTEEDIPLNKTEEDIPLDKTEEDIHLNETEENIHLNNTEEDIPLNNTEEDIPLNNTEEDIPLNKTEEDIPLDNTEEDIPLNNTEEDIPLDKTKEDIPLNETEENIPLNNTGEDILLNNTEEDIPLDKTEEDIPLDKTEEDIPLDKTEENIPLNETEENIHLNNTEEDIPLNNTEEDIPLNKTEEDTPLDKTEEDIHLNETEENIHLNNTEEDIPLNNTEEDIHLGKTEEEGIHLDKTEQEDIHLDKLKSSDFKDSNEVEEGKEDTISLETYGTKLYYSNSPENTIKETRSSEVEKDMLNKQQTSSDTIIDTSQFEKINEEINEEESIPDNTRSNDIDTQEYYVIGSHLDKTEENVNNNENNTSTASIEKLNSAIQPNQDNLEEVHKENQINAAILDRYQLIIQNVEHFFKTLYNTGYGHFGQIAKELGINPQTIDVAFYSSTAAVIICFQHLPDEGSYTKYQNLLLTLSNLFRSFNINMVRPLKQQEINNTDLSMGNPVKQTLLTLETIFASYLKNIDISDFLNVLELRCSFDYWLLTNNDCEIPMDLLPPSKFSQYDFEIASSLKDQSELSIETKPRINDFIHLFTYLNIYDGYDKRIVVDEWTKPEIGNILNALLNFGFNSASSADFIAKTYIITKSIGNISSCIGEILKILKSEPNVENNSFKGIDDEVFKTINFNTDIYEKIGVIVNNPSNYSLTEIEIEFLKIILKFGIQSFNDIFSDSRYDFKDKLPMFGNFEMFTNRISEVIERSK